MKIEIDAIERCGLQLQTIYRSQNACNDCRLFNRSTTLVVGYSVKALGIAQDLFGTSEHYVLPVQMLQNPEDLVLAYNWLVEHEEEIRQHLNHIMPDYINKAYETGREVDRLWEELS